MATVKLFVGLKIPDTTAITASQTIHRMGFHELKKLEREDYFEFSVSSGIEEFKKKIVKADVIVNANKNYFRVDDTDKTDSVIILVSDIGKHEGLLSTLKNRLGFSNIESVKKAVLWKMHIDAKDKKEIAEKIAKELLFNENYQECRIVD